MTEKVSMINLETNQIEVELLAYDGKTVLLDVGEEAVEDLHKIKIGDGATLRVVEEDGKRIVKSFRIRSKDPECRSGRCCPAGLGRYTLAQSKTCD